MFRLIKQVLIALLNVSESLASIVNAPDHIKQISLNDQQSMVQPYGLTSYYTLKDYVIIHLQWI